MTSNILQNLTPIIEHYDTYTTHHRRIINESPNMAQEGDEGYGDTHCNEDYGDFRQAAPSKSAHLWVSGVLHHSNSDKGNPRCLKSHEVDMDPVLR